MSFVCSRRLCGNEVEDVMSYAMIQMSCALCSRICDHGRHAASLRVCFVKPLPCLTGQSILLDVEQVATRTAACLGVHGMKCRRLMLW